MGRLVAIEAGEEEPIRSGHATDAWHSGTPSLPTCCNPRLPSANVTARSTAATRRCKRELARTSSLLDFRYREPTADLTRKGIRYLVVARHSLDSTRRRIRPQRVRPALTLQVASMAAKVSEKITSLHPTTTFSRTASRGRARRPSRRRSSRIRAIAAAKL